ncbi:hypothetical protein BGZ46_005610 [Entomortierella lignicola]|nr:hypothetical protein BGZ46_005610 [Entomortierella lignicola]
MSSSNLYRADISHAYLHPRSPNPNPNSKRIFSGNVTPPIVKCVLPKAGERITSTPQLAYCLHILRHSLESKDGLSEEEIEWLQTEGSDLEEQKRLQSLAKDIVEAFVQDELKEPDAVTEVAFLAAVLDGPLYNILFHTFIDCINNSALLEIHLLGGLAQLIRNAGQGYLTADDIIRISDLLNKRLKDTHVQSTRQINRLALTTSHLLDSMVDSQIKGSNYVQFHESLSQYLRDLQQNPDPYLYYQAVYAYQAIQYIHDDDTTLRSMIRSTGKVVQGISNIFNRSSGSVGVVKDFIIYEFDSLGPSYGPEEPEPYLTFQSGLSSKTSATAKEAFSFTHKSGWYPALRILDALLHEGRLADLETSIWQAPCRNDNEFLWGVCQRLGDLAGSTIWDNMTRKCAIDFLGVLYKRPGGVIVKQWILRILNQLADSFMGTIAGQQAQVVIQELEKHVFYKPLENEHAGPYPMMVIQPPQESPLLEYIQNRPETDFSLLKQEREYRTDQSKPAPALPIHQNFHELHWRTRKISGETQNLLGVPELSYITEYVPINVQKVQDFFTDSTLELPSEPVHHSRRRKISMETKIEILRFVDQNPDVSMKSISEKFGIPRTTLHAIIKNKIALKAVSSLSDKKKPVYRLSKPLNSTLETLLATWVKDLAQRGITVTGKKITTQAFEIRRMISVVMNDPSLPSLFSSAWRKRFKHRVDISPATIQDNSPNLGSHSQAKQLSSLVDSQVKQLSSLVDNYALSSIYTCGESSMFLTHNPEFKFGFLPVAGMDKPPSISASILLCCNASGTDMRMPRIDVRKFSTDSRNLDMSTFDRWLLSFDDSLNQDTLLLVDNTTWDLINIDTEFSKIKLQRIKIVSIPQQFSPKLPINHGLAMRFKIKYSKTLLELNRGQLITPLEEDPEALKDYVNLIHRSWQDIPDSVVRSFFGEFFNSIDPSRDSQTSGIKLADDENDLTLLLSKHGMPQSIVEYYLSQDVDTGPSNFMYMIIHQMVNSGEIDKSTACPELRYVTQLDVSQSPALRNEQGSQDISRQWTQARDELFEKRFNEVTRTQ